MDDIFKLNGTDMPFNESDTSERNFSNANSSLHTLDVQDHVPYFGEYLIILRHRYSAAHGYLTFIVCVFGITANVLNIIVLTRKNMFSPTNAILTGLAVADTLVMFSYLPFTYHNYIREDISEKEKFSYGWAVFALLHAHFTVVNHTVSIWLTVMVAFWRYMAVSFPAKSIIWCSMPRAKYAIIATYVTCVVFCIPTYITFTVSKFSGADGETIYKVYFSDIAQRHDHLLEKINFWLYGVITKLVPSVALTAVSLGLIRVLYEAKKRKQRLKHREENDRSHHRTTKMLLIVLLLFLLTEFPSGLLALSSGILGTEFFNNVYLNFAEIMDAVALIDSSINFIIYCSMCKKFRQTFSSLFIPKCINRQQIALTAELPKTVVTTSIATINVNV